MADNRFSGDFEDISSRSDDYLSDDYEDIFSGREEEIEYYYEDEGSYSFEEIQDELYENQKYIRMEDISSKTPKKKKRRSLRKRIMRAIGIIFLVFVLLIGILVLSVYNKLSHAESPDHVNKYISADELHSDKSVTNILLVGVDAREGETMSRSDTMIILSIDRKTKKMKATSFLRDSYVDIPEHGKNKLNASMAFGGIDLLRDTLEYNFRIKIDNYMLVDFKAFEEMIDALGGVDVPITEKEADFLNTTWRDWSLTGNELHFDSGESVHLNGEEALMFCRIRKLDSDFERTRRQRDTITGIKKELRHTNPLELIRLSNKMFPHIETDITSPEMIKLGLGALFRYLRYDIETLGVPIDGTWRNEMNKAGACLVFDINDTAEKLYQYIYNDINPLGETEK